MDDPSKIDMMKNWPQPKTVKQFQAFFELIGYYQRFICQYSTIAAPLTEFLKKNGFGGMKRRRWLLLSSSML